MNAGPVLIMAGGTGGHVFPALAVARELEALGTPVVWLGTRAGLEADVVPRAGFAMESIQVTGLRGKGMTRLLKAPFMLALALWQALGVLRRVRPRAVLGMGGFVTGPGGLMAWLTRRPLLIHEQNSVAGLTNRILSRFATRVMEAFPGSLPEAVHTGNPVREDIAALPEPEHRVAAHEGAMHLLVLGGSLGAQALNEVVPRAVARLSGVLRPEVWHQTGRRKLDAGRRAYEMAAVGPEDIDVAELHDATSFGELQQSEAVGFCPLGEGGRFAESGATKLGGKLPINPSGGLESRGHPLGASGLAQIHEIVTQLRHEAGNRQVENCRLGLAENGGGLVGYEGAAMGIHLLERFA